MGKHHHGGGYRGFGPGYGYPWQAPATEVFVVDDSDTVARAMAYVMSLPKAQRRAAYEKLTGKVAPASLSGYEQTQYRAADTLALGYYPVPGAPESLGCGGGCGCGGKCGGMGDVMDTIKALPMPVKLAAAVIGVLFISKRMNKRR